MRAHEPRALGAVSWDGTPRHHRRQPHDELLDRRRIASRARSVTEPELIPLDRVEPRLQPIIAHRRAAARAASTRNQRVHHDATGLVRQRPARGPVPAAARNCATKGEVLQRHRQRRARTPGNTGEQTLAAQLAELAARGARRHQACGDPPPQAGIADPSGERLEFGNAFMWAPHGAGVAEKAANERPGCYPVFLVPGRPIEAGRDNGRAQH